VAPQVLDGSALSGRRAPRLRERALAVEVTRGARPRLLLVAFEEDAGRAPWIPGKLRACADAAVEVRTLVLPSHVTPGRARAHFASELATSSADGVFVQFPFPRGFDGDLISAMIPADADIDLMRPQSVLEFLDGARSDPPLTVVAALELLRAHGISVQGHSALVVGERTRFNRMLEESLARGGADVDVVSAGSRNLTARLGASTLVVTSAATPGAVRSHDLAPGSIVVDGGYFNPGGAGDVDIARGIEHLSAFAPVPGGVGPMTVSALVEAVVSSAEASGPAHG